MKIFGIIAKVAFQLPWLVPLFAVQSFAAQGSATVAVGNHLRAQGHELRARLGKHCPASAFVLYGQAMRQAKLGEAAVQSLDLRLRPVGEVPGHIQARFGRTKRRFGINRILQRGFETGAHPFTQPDQNENRCHEQKRLAEQKQRARDTEPDKEIEIGGGETDDDACGQHTAQIEDQLSGAEMGLDKHHDAQKGEKGGKERRADETPRGENETKKNRRAGDVVKQFTEKIAAVACRAGQKMIAGVVQAGAQQEEQQGRQGKEPGKGALAQRKRSTQGQGACGHGGIERYAVEQGFDDAHRGTIAAAGNELQIPEARRDQAGHNRRREPEENQKLEQTCPGAESKGAGQASIAQQGLSRQCRGFGHGMVLGGKTLRPH